MVVYGYRINGTNMDEIWNAIAVVQKKMSKIASKIYHEQLGKEIAFLCDNVTLSFKSRRGYICLRFCCTDIKSENRCFRKSE